MIITIREPTDEEMRRHLLRCGWREDKSAGRTRGDEHWIKPRAKQESLDIYTAFIQEARSATESAVFKPQNGVP